MKDEPIPQFEHSPFQGSGTPHPWIPLQDTLTPVADSNRPESASLEPNTLINWKESD